MNFLTKIIAGKEIEVIKENISELEITLRNMEHEKSFFKLDLQDKDNEIKLCKQMIHALRNELEEHREEALKDCMTINELEKSNKDLEMKARVLSEPSTRSEHEKALRELEIQKAETKACLKLLNELEEMNYKSVALSKEEYL